MNGEYQIKILWVELLIVDVFLLLFGVFSFIIFIYGAILDFSLVYTFLLLLSLAFLWLIVRDFLEFNKIREDI